MFREGFYIHREEVRDVLISYQDVEKDIQVLSGLENKNFLQVYIYGGSYPVMPNMDIKLQIIQVIIIMD